MRGCKLVLKIDVNSIKTVRVHRYRTVITHFGQSPLLYCVGNQPFV